LYPARFSPEAAAAVISTYSHPGDWILDPFMGAGTAVVEALMAGRRIVGVDLNALGHFVATVRTTPLSDKDRSIVRIWAEKAAEPHGRHHSKTFPILNLPEAVASFMRMAIARLAELPFRRQRSFARCVLLRLGQKALDCRDDTAHDRQHLAMRLPQLVDELLNGLQQFVRRCGEAGIPKNEVTSRRLLLLGDARRAVTLCEREGVRPNLVFTSPPYPKVHVLYHRWQVCGRSETPAPYWIADIPDGYYASHYTGGSRTRTGERKYFQMIQEVFSSLRAVIHPEATVAQLVGFANARKQLPIYLRAMREAGYEEEPLPNRRLWRPVPNRKWHARLQGALDASSEVLLIHHPVRKPRG
jgi:DNA methylase